MSAISFFQTLLSGAENALASAEPVVGPLIQVAEAAAPVVEALDPAAIPVVTAIQAGAASIAAIAPTAVQDTSAIINAGKAAYTDLAPTLAKLESAFDSLFHITVTPGSQAIVLTPKTSAATASAS